MFVERAYLLAVPLATAAAIALLARRRDRLLALGALALGVGLVGALALVYVGGQTGVRYLVSSTAERTLITPTLLAAVLLPLLVTRALGASQRADRLLQERSAAAGNGSSSSSKTRPSASTAAGRTSSTVSGRPSSRAIVVKAASSIPQAVIHSRERRGIEVDVERVAVRRDPLRDVDADRRDLARRRRQPDAREPLDPRRLEAEGGERLDQRLLEVAAVLLHVLAVARQVEDRVADELARAVIRRLAAAVGLDDLDGGVRRARAARPARRGARA